MKLPEKEKERRLFVNETGYIFVRAGSWELGAFLKTSELQLTCPCLLFRATPRRHQLSEFGFGEGISNYP